MVLTDWIFGYQYHVRIELVVRLELIIQPTMPPNTTVVQVEIANTTIAFLGNT